jgi:O-antigen/teichoic acid export membrane protein
MDLKKIIVKNTYFTIWGDIAVGLIYFCAAIVFSRILDPSDIAMIAVVHLFVNTISDLISFGMARAIIQIEGREEKTLSSFFWLICLTHAVFSLTLYYLAPVIATFIDYDAGSPILRITAIFLFVQSIRLIPELLLQKQFRLGVFSFYCLLREGVYAVVTIALVVFGFGIWSIMWGLFAGLTMSLMFLFYKTKWVPQFILSIDFKEFSVFIKEIYLLKGLAFIYRYIEFFCVAFFLDIRQIGYFYFAYKIAEFLSGRIAILCQRFLYPLFTTVGKEGFRELKRIFNKGNIYVCVFAFPIYLYLILAAEEIVTIIYGHKWKPAISPLRILAFCQLIRIFSRGLFPTVLISQKKVNYLNVVWGSAVFVMPLMMALIGSRGDLQEIAYALMFFEVAFLVIIGIHIFQMQLFSFDKLFNSGKLIFLAVTSCFIAYISMGFVPVAHTPLFFMRSVLYFVIYFIMLYYLGFRKIFFLNELFLKHNETMG